MRIMTVCLGNICRSPAAEAVLNRKLAEAGLDDVEVTSAGTSDEHVGARPHHLTREVGGELGYEFPTVGVQLSADLVDDADLILVMDEANLADARRLATTDEQRDRIHLMGEFASDADSAGVREVPDPYGYPRPQFEEMYRQIEDAADGVVAAIRRSSAVTISRESWSRSSGSSCDRVSRRSKGISHTAVVSRAITLPGYCSPSIPSNPTSSLGR